MFSEHFIDQINRSGLSLSQISDSVDNFVNILDLDESVGPDF